MMYLFDSNAIAIIIKRLKGKAIEALDGNATLNLARYELGNMLWKECVLKGLISREEALQNAEDVARILEVLRIEGIESSVDFKEAMKLATGLKLTFYDASYLYLAKNKINPPHRRQGTKQKSRKNKHQNHNSERIPRTACKL